MKLIVGLGNPGEKYVNTRHNVGFMALDSFLRDFEPEKETSWNQNSKFKSDIAEIVWQRQEKDPGKIPHGEEKVILAKPLTYMNDSGLAVKLLVDFYKVKMEDLWILHDDVDFPAGSMRIRLGGASAGHRGITSIIDALGTDKFYRFRLGIGRPGESEHSGVSHYVLDTFNHEDHSKIRELLKRSTKAIELGLEKDLESAMNKYNSK